MVDAIGPAARSTERPGVMAGLGGFGGFFDPKAAGFKDPVLVAATDGVGTKLKIAQAAKDHRTIGIDLVAMCVNDLVVQGAEPLFFLDYFATSRLSVAHTADVVAGIAEGCRQAGCALIGGETAEMPGMYQGDGDYDLAGFRRRRRRARQESSPAADIEAGDLVLRPRPRRDCIRTAFRWSVTGGRGESRAGLCRRRRHLRPGEPIAGRGAAGRRRGSTSRACLAALQGWRGLRGLRPHHRWRLN